MKSSEVIHIEGARILIVDDDAVIRRLIRRVLERSDFIVDEAESGELAIQRIHENAPDLILLDVVMDGIDGFVTCRRIKAMEHMETVPIIFVTGRSDTESIVQGLDAGGADYVTKPINRHEALARIRNHLKMRVLMRFQQQYIDGLKKANMAKNRIIGVASHDLRNPLASIRGLSEFMIETDSLNPEQLEILQSIQTTSNSMLQLVDDLLDLSVMESGEERAKLEPCPLVELIRSSIHIYRFPAEKKSIRLEFINQGLPEQLMLDTVQFRRLLDNLLSNAVKYSPHGSLIRMVAAASGDRVTIAVEDEGPGIPEDEMHKLFTDFGKTSVQPTGNESSTGLGLSIAKKIAKLHQGRVYVENRTDRSGARFIIELDARALEVMKDEG